MRTPWHRYLFQSLLAVASLALILFLLRWRHWAIVTALGSTVFVLFVMPHRPVAAPRNTFVGHLIGIVCGLLCAYIPHRTELGTALVYALAVGLSIFVMLLTDTEQPPAAGTALAFVIRGYDLTALVGTLLSVLILSVIHLILKPYLRDLVGPGDPVERLRPP
jgi:CBS-domain-containing membrane protein